MAMPVSYTCVRVLNGHDGPVNAVKFNQEGTYCMSAGADKRILLWNPHKDMPGEEPGSSGFLIKEYAREHGYPVHDIAISHDNCRFASCGGDKHVLLWDVARAVVVRKFFGHEHRVNSVAFNFESSILASGSYDGTVRLWDCRSNNRASIQDLAEFKDSVSSVLITDCEIIAASIDGCIRTYDIRRGQLRTDTLGDPITSISLSNDKNCVLASCLTGNGMMRLIERSGGEELNRYTGYQNESYSIGNCFSLDDAYVMTCSEDGQVYIFDLVEATEIAKLQGHTRTASSLHHHPSKTMLLSSSYDGTVRVWQKQG